MCVCVCPTCIYLYVFIYIYIYVCVCVYALPSYLPFLGETGPGGMDLTEFIKVLRRFSAAEHALAEAAEDAEDSDLDYNILLSQVRKHTHTIIDI